MSGIPFWKLQSVGNDFVMVHASDVGDFDLQKLAESVCHRRFGVGSDGLLVMEGTLLRMFNPDGTEDFCGNGLRCAAVHAFELGWISESAVLRHGGRDVAVQITGSERARIELPPATFEPDLVPHLMGVECFECSHETSPGTARVLSALSTGTTHTVILVDSLPEDGAFFAESAALEVHPDFPERTSVIWAQVSSPSDVKLRIFERGVGETLGCGTGSAAAAVGVARKVGVGGRITVQNPGGDMEAHLEDWRSTISLEAVANEVYRGVLDASLLESARISR